MTHDPPNPGPFSRPPAPPSPELIEAAGPNLAEYLRRRLETMERELQQERHHSREASDTLRTQDATRAEVDKQLKSLIEQLKQEKLERENAESNSRSRGRIDALEQRLDEMHKTWAGLLSQAIERRESGESNANAAARAEATQTRQELDALQQALRDVPTHLESAVRELKTGLDEPGRFASEIAELRAQVARSTTARQDGERLTAEDVRKVVSQFAETVAERLSDMDRRFAIELEKNRERAETISKERAMMEHALEEERHRLRQEYAKEQLRHQSLASEHSGESAKALARLAMAQEAANKDAAALREEVARLQAALDRPEAAKDQIVLDLEREKRDLLKALRDRTEQVRAYTLERREVERSMGESLMELNRQLEAERSKHQTYEAQIADLKAQLHSQRQEEDLARRAAEAAERRFAALAAEREELLKSLLAETDKARASLGSKLEADKAHDAAAEAKEQELAQERQGRRAAEQEIVDLREQIQTLTDHITRTLREKDRIDTQSAAWIRERDELVAALRKKDEMVSMLSSTFQNLLKK